MSPDCKIPVHTKLPLKSPYRTGSYLIRDYTGKVSDPKWKGCPAQEPDHFRIGTSVPSVGLRASGSRQLDAELYSQKLKIVAAQVPERGTLYVVDLRQESHLFFDGSAVSWYADKDWSNVGQSLDWIVKDEACLIDMSCGKTVQIFSYEEDKLTGDITPNGYCNVSVESAFSEEEIVTHVDIGPDRRIVYERIPVTDHCRPTMEAVRDFVDLIWNLNPKQTWIHFHCHGGDGRTTTFLAMYDMFCTAKSGTENFPSTEKFAARQMQLFCYDLNPAHNPGGPCNEEKDWKCALMTDRWKFLIAWHDWLQGGALRNGTPFAYKEPA